MILISTVQLVPFEVFLRAHSPLRRVRKILSFATLVVDSTNMKEVGGNYKHKQCTVEIVSVYTLSSSL